VLYPQRPTRHSVECAKLQLLKRAIGSMRAALFSRKISIMLLAACSDSVGGNCARGIGNRRRAVARVFQPYDFEMIIVKLSTKLICCLFFSYLKY
jgi:hypothetical protein